MATKKYAFLICSIALLYVSAALAVTPLDLQKQIDDLRAEVEANQPPLFQFSRDLYVGLKNDIDVSRLQEFLIQRNYANFVISTGNFYSLTREAVRTYQMSNALPSTGYFGPLTRARVNATLAIERQGPGAASAINAAETGPIEIPKEANLPESFDTRIDNQISGEMIYDLYLIGRSIQVLVNEERGKFGLDELIWDNSLAEMARLHSVDQAQDNKDITDPDVICHYPLIRHEGIRGGYGMVDRLRAGDIFYRAAGENIVIFSTGKNLLYTYRAGNPPPPCKDVPAFTHEEGTREERLGLFQDILNQSLAAVAGLQSVEWVNKEYLSYEEIAEKAVNLWMNSPGHRDNILRGIFNYAGIGVAKVNDYLIITQNFVGR